MECIQKFLCDHFVKCFFIILLASKTDCLKTYYLIQYSNCSYMYLLYILYGYEINNGIFQRKTK